MLLIDMSTILPITPRSLASGLEERGVGMLDAAVSGGEEGAKTATLSIMVGGSEEHFRRAQPVFSVLGKTITYCGPQGSGQIVKACNHALGALIIEPSSQAFVLVAKAGVAPTRILNWHHRGPAHRELL